MLLKKFALSLCALGFAGSCMAGDVKVIEEIVAKVNNEIITKGELDTARQQAAADIARQQMPADRVKQALKEVESNALRDKIDNLLLVQKAKDLSIDVDSDVSKRLAQIQLDSKISDPDKFQAFVREQTHMSYEDFKQQLKDNLLTGEVVRREVGSRITISKAEQQQYYEEHKKDFVREEQVVLQEILISTDGKDEKGIAVAEKKAKDLVARARKGENFGNMAHDNSDADTAQNYGELPAFKRGVLKKEIEDVVFTKEKGYVTDPIRQPNGFLILRVSEHYKPGLQPFEAVENEIMEKLYMPRMTPAVRAYLTKLRQEAFLQIRAGYIDSGAAPGKDTAWKDPAKLKPQTVTKEEVAMRPRRRKLLWMIPIPGTSVKPKEESGASTPVPPAVAAPKSEAQAPPAVAAPKSEAQAPPATEPKPAAPAGTPTASAPPIPKD